MADVAHIRDRGLAGANGSDAGNRLKFYVRRDEGARSLPSWVERRTMTIPFSSAITKTP
jgi:hypothetical protein